MSFRVRNKTTKAEYSTFRLADDEEVLSEDVAEIFQDGVGGRFKAAVYPDEALQVTPEPEAGVFTPDTVVSKTDDSPPKATRSGRR